MTVSLLPENPLTSDCPQDCGPRAPKLRAIVIVHLCLLCVIKYIQIQIGPYSGVQGATQLSLLVKSLLSYLIISAVKYVFLLSLKQRSNTNHNEFCFFVSHCRKKHLFPENTIFYL